MDWCFFGFWDGEIGLLVGLVGGKGRVGVVLCSFFWGVVIFVGVFFVVFWFVCFSFFVCLFCFLGVGLVCVYYCFCVSLVCFHCFVLAWLV